MWPHEACSLPQSATTKGLPQYDIDEAGRCGGVGFQERTWGERMEGLV